MTFVEGQNPYFEPFSLKIPLNAIFAVFTILDRKINYLENLPNIQILRYPIQFFYNMLANNNVTHIPLFLAIFTEIFVFIVKICFCLLKN